MSNNLRNLKILVADNHKANLDIVSIFLRKLGHETVIAENGQEAVAAFSTEHPDLVLMAMNMPVMDGLAATRQIRETSQKCWVPIIFIFATDEDPNVVDGLAAGGDDFITKPINFVVLEAKIRLITHALVSDEQARETLSRLLAISDTVSEAILTLDEQGVITNCNRAVEQIFRCLPDELIGKPGSILFSPETPLSWLSNSSSEDGTEISSVRRDGTQVLVLARTREVTTPGYRQTICIFDDLTERQEHEATLRSHTTQLARSREEGGSAQDLAKNLIERQLDRSGLHDPCLHYWFQPCSQFPGNAIAARRSADGKRLYVLLAEAKGHGMAPTFCVLPVVLSLFYQLAAIGQHIGEMVSGIHQQLVESAPIGSFVDLSLACVTEKNHHAEIWHSGTTMAMLVDPFGRPVEHILPSHQYLGSLTSGTLSLQSESLRWIPGYQMLLASEGLLSAENASGEKFGEDRLLKTLALNSPNERLSSIQASLGLHLGKLKAQKDMSLLLVDAH